MSRNATAADVWPNPPTFDDELVESCRAANDCRPLLHEWFRFSALLCNFVAGVDHRKSAAIAVSDRLGIVIRGLMVRASRLSLANLCLHSEGRFGDSSPILSRSIQETCIRVSWLLDSNSEVRLTRYLAEGLKSDIRFKRTIEENVDGRGGDVLPIEARMLASISARLNECGLSEQDVLGAKKMPTLLDQLPDGNWKEEIYGGIQRMGSHSVHGTWTNLIQFYLDSAEDEPLQPWFQPHEARPTYYVFDSLLILRAVEDWAKICVENLDSRHAMISQIAHARDEIRDLGFAADERLREAAATDSASDSA